MKEIELESIADKLEKIKESKHVKNFSMGWKDNYNISPYEVVKKFIMDKGLKIYGGLALHEYLKKYKEPIYGNDIFPDYDVYSPNAWEQAKELCDILYKLGFYFVEARSSILNDEHHQTYKVSVDMENLLDITQSGCTPIELSAKKCKKCGQTKDKKCFSIFNHIPCMDVNVYRTKQKNTTYTKTFDYENNKSLYPNKLFVSSPDWLKANMFKELTQPFSNPSRFVKVSTRLNKFNKYLKTDLKCEDNNLLIKDEFMPILNYIGKFVKKHKLINYGASAYNFFVKGSSKDYNINIPDYEVYSDNLTVYSALEDSDIEILNKNLKSKFKNFKFIIQEKIMYWKEVDITNYSILSMRNNTNKYNNIITFTQIDACMPYLQYNGVRYATVDTLKYNYLRAISLPQIYQYIEINPKNYNCLLNNLLKVEKEFKKKYPKSKKTKFRQFVKKCEGEPLEKIYENLLTRYADKIALTKKTKHKINYPKKGFITKTYPIPTTDEKFPYKPAEMEVKHYKDYSKNLENHLKKNSKNSKKSKKSIFNDIL